MPRLRPALVGPAGDPDGRQSDHRLRRVRVIPRTRPSARGYVLPAVPTPDSPARRRPGGHGRVHGRR